MKFQEITPILGSYAISYVSMAEGLNTVLGVVSGFAGSLLTISLAYKHFKDAKRTDK